MLCVFFTLFLSVVLFLLIFCYSKPYDITVRRQDQRSTVHMFDPHLHVHARFGMLEKCLRRKKKNKQTKNIVKSQRLLDASERPHTDSHIFTIIYYLCVVLLCCVLCCCVVALFFRCIFILSLFVTLF